MTTIEQPSMALSKEDLNEMDRWILTFLAEHEWATPNLLRHLYADEVKDVSRQWVSNRVGRLLEHGHLQRVHPDAYEVQLVEDPRNGSSD